MNSIKALNLGITFVLEMCMLVALSYWGFNSGNGLAGWALGIGIPLGVATLWGMVLAPRARRRLDTGWGLILTAILFGWATFALYSTGHPWLALAFGTAAVINRGLTFGWQQWHHASHLERHSESTIQ